MSKLKEKLQSNLSKILETVGQHLPNKVPNKVRKERIEICLSCDKFNFSFQRCRICGCVMRLKTWLPGEKCPINKWVEYTNNQEINK